MVSKERIFEIRKGRPNDPMSIGCDVFLSVLIIINVIAVCLETVEALNTAQKHVPVYRDCLGHYFCR